MEGSAARTADATVATGEVAARRISPGSDEWYADDPNAGEFWEEPAEPVWARRLSVGFEREQLAACASGAPGGWSAEVLERCCPDGREGRDARGLDAAGLVDGIAGLQRLINWAQACQQRYVAALARPGVVLPVADLVDVAQSPLGLHRQVPDGATTASLLADPVWGPAVRQAAVKVAAAGVGCALRVAPSTARGRVERAVAMVDHLPGTLAAQQSGVLDGYRASIVCERSSVLSPGQRARLERAVLPIIIGRTACRVRDVVDREVARIDPDAAAKRERQARAGRGVRAERGEDGMGCVRADLPADDAQLTVQVLDRIAGAVQAAGLAAGRGRSQIRADVFTDLFRDLAATGQASIGGTGGIGGMAGDSRVAGGQPGPAEHAHPDAAVTAGDEPGAPGGRRGGRWEVPIRVNVYVPAATLAGWDDRPGELAGHGVISADFARALADSAASVRAIAVHPPPATAEPTAQSATGSAGDWTPAGHSTDPVRARWCGSVLDAGRSVYRARKALADHLTARDRTCQFPGCRAAADTCDLDHRLAWDSGGVTCPCNQDPLCRTHHLLKTFTRWHARPGPDGNLEWTSPTGHRYRTEPGHPLLDGDDGWHDARRIASDHFSPTGGDKPTEAAGPPLVSASGLPDDDPPDTNPPPF